jgi:hypothetical protein
MEVEDEVRAIVPDPVFRVIQGSEDAGERVGRQMIGKRKILQIDQFGKWVQGAACQVKRHVRSPKPPNLVIGSGTVCQLILSRRQIVGRVTESVHQPGNMQVVDGDTFLLGVLSNT